MINNELNVSGTIVETFAGGLAARLVGVVTTVLKVSVDPPDGDVLGVPVAGICAVLATFVGSYVVTLGGILVGILVGT